ncbi:hypothetical protein FQN54_003532 [Arachnomyces sp. PD_36]|nr:hypothetical protein FQN54_003532 [Arachnomyces sp. PD_36]
MASLDVTEIFIGLDLEAETLLGEAQALLSEYAGLFEYRKKEKRATVVLADSRIVNANEKENTDFFRALNGGDASLGICVRIIYMLKDLASVQFQLGVVTAIQMSTVPNHGLREGYTRQTWTALPAGPPPTHELRTMSSLPDFDMYKAANECRLQQIEALGHIDGVFLTMVIQPIASGAIKTCDAKGGTPLGIKARTINVSQVPLHRPNLSLITNRQKAFLLMSDRKHAIAEEEMRGACRKIVDTAEAFAEISGT